MPKTADDRRHWRLLPQWPELDRTLWLAGTKPCDDLDIPEYGQHLSQASLATIERMYGRYLNFLDGCGALDPLAPPASRVTPQLMAQYLRHLYDSGYMSQTIILAISGLRSTLQIIAPEYDSSWLWHPNGVSLVSRLHRNRKTFDVPHTADLFQWGIDLMNVATQATARRRLTTYRDGLMIALLAARPLRRRTFAGLMVGRHLVRQDQTWRLILEPEDMKNRRALEVPVPESLWPSIGTYLSEIRPALLRGTQTDALWIATQGSPMALTAVGLMIRVRAKKRFGVEFGPHRFRHALGTTASAVDPANPGTAAAVLAVGAGMVEKHYNRAENHVAAAGFHDALKAERTELGLIARRLFQPQGTPKYNLTDKA